MNFRYILLPIFGLIATGNAISANVVTITSPADYHKHYNSDKPMVTMYTSESCGPCRGMKPHFHSAAAAASDITFAIVDTGAAGLSGLAEGIRGLPTMIFSHKGKQVNRELGSRTRAQIDGHIHQFRTKVAPTQSASTSQKTVKKRVPSSPAPRAPRPQTRGQVAPKPSEKQTPKR